MDKRVFDVRRMVLWKRILILMAIMVLFGLASCAGDEEVLPPRPEDITAAQEVYQVELELQGEPSMVLEYSDRFQDPGAKAVGYGTVRDTQRVELQVRVDGQVCDGVVGEYVLTYTAEYEGVSQSVSRKVQVVDTTAPQITLVSDPDKYTMPGEQYAEEGFSAVDGYDGDLTDQVVRQEKDGVVYYSVTDSSGNVAQVQREVRYHDPVAPVLTLSGSKQMEITAGDAWKEPGYTATDNVDGDLTDRVTVSGKVDRNMAGTYVLRYEVTDSYGNTATAERTVVVKKQWQPETVEPNGKVIYLTFDDGPWSDTPELLEVLRKYDVKATFFVVNNTKFIHLLKDIAADGHTVAIHSKTHKYAQIYANDQAFLDDMYAMQDIIYEHTGKKTTLIRFPGGSSNGVSKKYNEGIMTRLTKTVESLGFQYFDWNVDSDDAGSADTPYEVYQNVIEGVKEKDYSVVLMHDTRSYTVDAIEMIIQWGLENGYTFLPLEASSPTCHHTWMKN